MAVTVTTKAGKTYCGPLWAWRPLEGYFTITCDDCGDVHTFKLEDVDAAVDRGRRVGKKDGEPVLEDVDLLVKARREAMSWCPPGK